MNVNATEIVNTIATEFAKNINTRDIITTIFKDVSIPNVDKNFWIGNFNVNISIK